MKHPHYSAILGVFLTFAMACAAQTLAKPEGGGVSPALRTGEAGKPAVPAAPAATPEKAPKAPTEITAREATFDNAAHLATFTTDVVVKDPEFNLTSDRLTVYLKKPSGSSTGSGQPKPVKEANPKAEEGAEGGIEKAIAEGNVTIIQEKIDAAGKPQRYIGKGKKAVYETATGTVTLYGWPQVGQSIGGTVNKQIISRAEDCVITMTRAGKIDVKGYHTTILQDTSAVDQHPK